MLVVVCLGISTSVTAQNSFFLVSSENLNCIRNYADNYFSASLDDVIFIRPEDCGTEAAIPLKLLEFVENAAPDLPEADDAGTLRPDAVIALNRADVSCLAELVIPANSVLLAYYPESCHVESKP